jgi:hypothetical protein
MGLVPCYWQWIADARFLRMARPLRIQVVDGWNQVIGSEIAGQSLFRRDNYRRAFLALISELPERFGAEARVLGSTGVLPDRARGQPPEGLARGPGPSIRFACWRIPRRNLSEHEEGGLPFVEVLWQFSMV